MDAEGIRLSEISQKEKGKYYMIALKCKKDNKLVNITKKKQTYREQTRGCQWGEGRSWGKIRVRD